jgi:1-acyl-sn-glycerol-3-phosphate acyltransferase
MGSDRADPGEERGLTMEPVIRLPRSWYPADSVDEWGRDAHLIELLTPAATMRWDVSIGGVHHLPKRGGALLVTNSRQFSLSAIYAAWALTREIGRPVRFGGRPDIVPFGPLLQRLGGLLNKPEEISGALRAGELVVVSAKGTRDPRHAGVIDPKLVATAIASRTPVYPVASITSMFGRAARVEVGPAVRPRRKRRGPLAELELAELTQLHIQRLIDGLGGLHTGVAPIDWLAEG